MNSEVNPIDLPKLKQLIHNDLEVIPSDKNIKQAVIVIGDTELGKTVVSFLSCPSWCAMKVLSPHSAIPKYPR
jgi:hypothetical protein